MRPLVSVITPAYNSGKFIAETIRSVQSQTFEDWEMVIVDDCSTDETETIILQFSKKDPRIKYVRLNQNSGAGIARNTATEKASGRYIAFLDADDLWLPEKLQKQLDFMETHGQPFSFCFYDCIGESGQPLGKRIKAPKNLRYRQLFFCNFVGNLTGIYDTDHFGKIEIHSIRKRQDWMLWLTILKKIRTAKPIPEPLALYRVRKGSISASKWDLVRHNFAVYRKFHQFSWMGSVLCMAGFLFVQFLVKPRYIEKIR